VIARAADELLMWRSLPCPPPRRCHRGICNEMANPVEGEKRDIKSKGQTNQHARPRRPAMLTTGI